MKRRKFIALAGAAAVGSVGVSNCGKQQKTPVILTVSAATSLQETLTDISQAYQRENPHVTIATNFAASGILKQQIEQGLPVDVLISASPKVMNELQDKNLVLAQTRQDIVKNSIVLIVPQDSINISNFMDLSSDRVKTVAMGSWDTLAVGFYTREVLTSWGILNQVQKKAVYANEGVRQVLKAVESKSVDAGLVFKTDAQLSNKVKVVAMAAENSHSPIVITTAAIANSQNILEAKEFIQFLLSAQAQSVFDKYGFLKV
jgi:molybdate transport system substrate-binding protein